MPIYQYICLDCGEKFEALRSMREIDAPINCDRCESEHTSRLLTVFYAHSAGKTVAGGSSSSGCASCAGGSCATCGQ